MADERLPVTICWHCDRPLDSAEELLAGSEKPTPGAISLCLYCGAVAVFGDDMRLIPPTKELLDSLERNQEFRQQYSPSPGFGST